MADNNQGQGQDQDPKKSQNEESIFGNIGPKSELPDIESFMKSSEEALDKVNAVYGPHDEFFDFVGLTIDEAMEVLQDNFSLPQDTEVFLDGKTVSPDQFSETELVAGQRLEFNKKAGQKGKIFCNL